MEETTAMSETPEQVETLDDVISQFAVDPIHAPVEEPKPTPEVQTMPEVFDPLDPDSVKDYARRSAEGYTALTSQLQSVKEKLTQWEQEKANAKVEADIKSVAEKFSEKAEVDPLFAEFLLEKTAREVPGFKKIWEARESNPKALERAINALSSQHKGKYEMRQDPKLTEDIRAAKQSQQSNTTTNQAEDDWPEPGTPEFDRKWRDLMNSG